MLVPGSLNGRRVAASVLELPGFSAIDWRLLFLSLRSFYFSLRCLISEIIELCLTCDPSSDCEFHTKQRRENSPHSLRIFVFLFLFSPHYIPSIMSS